MFFSFEAVQTVANLHGTTVHKNEEMNVHCVIKTKMVLEHIIFRLLTLYVIIATLVLF